MSKSLISLFSRLTLLGCGQWNTWNKDYFIWFVTWIAYIIFYWFSIKGLSFMGILEVGHSSQSLWVWPYLSHLDYHSVNKLILFKNDLLFTLVIVGKEGPFVHIASCIGNIVSRFFPKYETNEGRRFHHSFKRLKYLTCCQCVQENAERSSVLLLQQV